MFSQFSRIRRAAIACCLSTLFFVAAPLEAAPLTGSGPDLVMPTVNPPWSPGISATRATVTGGFTGTWTAPVQPDWVGTFNAWGQIPDANGTGIVRYNFSTLPNGFLPVGTFFIFGDVDGGSTLAERSDLKAFDGSGNELATEWLDVMVAYTGTGTGTGGAIVPGNMPGWDWNSINANTYRIDGATVTGGNPSIALALVSNQPIYTMELNKNATHHGFALQAPTVPEPSSALLAICGLFAFGAVSRNRVMQS